MSIQVKNLTHIYDKGMPGESVALDDISFEANDGEIIGIIGHTGSGKSTLLQHLNGILKADSGSITVDGVDITQPGVSMAQIRKRIGLVFQYPEYQLFEETVAEDVAFGPKNLGLDAEEIGERVREAIGLVGLDYDDIAERSPFELSGGQKRRVAIAGVVAMRPSVLMLDEPTAGLDPKAHRDILEMIKHVHEKSGNTTIIVSHDMGDIARMSDKILVVDNGRLAALGTPEEVFGQGELLHSIGLGMPHVTEFCSRIGIEKTVLDTDAAADEIKRLIDNGLLRENK